MEEIRDINWRNHLKDKQGMCFQTLPQRGLILELHYLQCLIFRYAFLCDGNDRHLQRYQSIY